MQRFQNEVAIVTGGAHGIGRATALRLASEGAAVAVVDLDEGAAQGSVDEIQRAGGRAYAIGADVTMRGQVEEVLRRVLAEYGQVDVLCNIAGIAIAESFLEIEDENWQKTLNDVKNMLNEATSAGKLFEFHCEGLKGMTLAEALK